MILRAIISAILISICFVSTPVRAEQTTGQDLLDSLNGKNETIKQVTMVMLNSYTQAYMYSQAIRSAREEPLDICIPGKLMVDGNVATNAFEGYLQRNPEKAKLPAPLVMYMALEETFPCESGY